MQYKWCTVLGHRTPKHRAPPAASQASCLVRRPASSFLVGTATGENCRERSHSRQRREREVAGERHEGRTHLASVCRIFICHGCFTYGGRRAGRKSPTV